MSHPCPSPGGHNHTSQVPSRRDNKRSFFLQEGFEVPGGARCELKSALELARFYCIQNTARLRFLFLAAEQFLLLSAVAGRGGGGPNVTPGSPARDGCGEEHCVPRIWRWMARGGGLVPTQGPRAPIRQNYEMASAAPRSGVSDSRAIFGFSACVMNPVAAAKIALIIIT